MVNSRDFMVKINGQYELIMSPIVDMLNHKSKRENKSTIVRSMVDYFFDDST